MDNPTFVGWHQLIGGIQRSQVQFDFVCGTCEIGLAAAGAKIPPSVVARLTSNRHRIAREHRRGVEKGPMMLATVETVTKANPVRESRRHESHVAAKAAAHEFVHVVSPRRYLALVTLVSHGLDEAGLRHVESFEKQLDSKTSYHSRKVFTFLAFCLSTHLAAICWVSCLCGECSLPNSMGVIHGPIKDGWSIDQPKGVIL